MYKKSYNRILLLILLSIIKIQSITENEAFSIYQKKINDDKFQSICRHIYKIHPKFFLENPEEYFPLTPSNMIDFTIICEPIINFLEPLYWNNIIFPENIDKVQSSLDAILVNSQTEVEHTHDKVVFCISSGTYSETKKLLFEAYKIIEEKNLEGEIFIHVNPERENINFPDETCEYIAKDIEETHNRKITDEEEEYIKNHIHNEYSIALIVNKFFSANKKISIFISYDQPIIDNFIDFLKNNTIYSAHIFFLDNELLSYYKHLQYMLETIENPELCNENYSFEFYKVKNLELNNEKNSLYRNKILKMVFLSLDTITSYIDENF